MRQQRAHAHGVVQRHHAQRAFAAAVEVLRDMRQRGGALGAVAARHALGLAGGARGVEHQRQVLGVGARHRRRRGAASTARRSAGRRPATAPTAMRGSLLRAPSWQRRGLALTGFVDHCACACASLEAVVDLVGLGAPVQRRHHHARELAGPVQRRHLPAVLQHDQQVVAAAAGRALAGRRHSADDRACHCA